MAITTVKSAEDLIIGDRIINLGTVGYVNVREEDNRVRIFFKSRNRAAWVSRALQDDDELTVFASDKFEVEPAA